MDMESENAKQPGDLRETAVDDLFQVWHPAVESGVEVCGREQVHADEDINRGDFFADLQDFGHDTSDARKERILAKGIDGDDRSRWAGPVCGRAPFAALLVFHAFTFRSPRTPDELGMPSWCLDPSLC